MFNKFFSIYAKMKGFTDKMINVYFFLFFFAFYVEIHDGHQKWGGGKNDFWEKSPVDYLDTLWIKNFIKIALPR